MISALLLLSNSTVPIAPGALFSVPEARAVVAEWRTPGRVRTVDFDTANPYTPLQSGEGATWLYSYFKLRSPGVRILPTQNPSPQNEQQAAWDAWIAKAYAQDFHRVALRANSMNQILRGFYGPPTPIPPRSLQTPPDLKALAGAPPDFAVLARPESHMVKLDGDIVILRDGPNIRDAYPFLRSATGVQNNGTPVTSDRLSSLASKAGLDSGFAHIVQAVSKLEGGFDAVNTYDTGTVSVGLIQFACLPNGTGSLGRLMVDYKSRKPAEFAHDFRRFGIDVTPYGSLVALDPDTGREFIGAEAAQKIVSDKRLTAVFQHAGRVSVAFQTAQLKFARDLFDPRQRQITAVLNGQSQTLRIADLFKSEAGLATVMDRLVNTGGLGETTSVVNQVATQYSCRTVADLSKLEDILVRRLTYRTDFLAVAGLTKPSPRADLVAMRAPVERPSSLSGDLRGNQPLTIIPGVNAQLSPSGEPMSHNTGNSPQAKTSGNAEPETQAETPVKPDEQVGRPITIVGG